MQLNCFNENPIEIASGTWAFSSSTCYSTSTPEAYMGFTYGEVVNSLFLFVIAIVLVVGYIRKTSRSRINKFYYYGS